MAVYRVNKNRGYTVMANFHLRDKSLSLKAVGLLSKMLSFNDGWKFSTKGLSAICKEGPDAILSALRELETHGYLVRHRQRDGKGRMSSTIFDIFEEPQPVSPDTGSPHMENPDMDKPDMDKPHEGNPAQINTNQCHSDADGVPDHEQPSETAEVRSKQEHTRHRRFRLRQDKVFCKAKSDADAQLLCGD